MATGKQKQKRPSAQNKSTQSAASNKAKYSRQQSSIKKGQKSFYQNGRKTSNPFQGKGTPGQRGRKNYNDRKSETPVRISFLGGLNEVGKNMTLYECNGDMILVDCGLEFPDPEMLGVDIVIPDFSYAVENADKIKGIFITHGHEDHIGGLAYLLKEINIPVYSTRLTIGLIEGKLREHDLLDRAELNVINPGGKVSVGCFEVEFIHVNHSIPDAVALAIKSPAGVVIQTGDFKIDTTPIDGGIIDMARLAELGNEGVLCLLSDSTNAAKPGFTESESKVGATFETLFAKANGKRLIVATFASNIHRVQQIINAAESYGRKRSYRCRRARLSQYPRGRACRHRFHSSLPLRQNGCRYNGQSGRAYVCAVQDGLFRTQKGRNRSERLRYNFGSAHTRQRKNGRQGSRRAFKAGRGGCVRENVRRPRFRPRLPGGA